MAIQKVILQKGGADAEARELRDKILNSPNCEITASVVYYLSQNGDDSNDGLSPEKAIKSYSKISELTLNPGDMVLFERGSIFRAEEMLKLSSGVYYGAYGEGEKPKIYGSLRDYADESIWEESNIENVWQTSIKTEEPASMINFNNDECIGTWQDLMDNLKSDGDFYHDIENGVFYLYFEAGNPGKYFYNIEIATTWLLMQAMHLNVAKDIKIENLCMKYATFGAIDVCRAENFHITNCELGWHGGRVFSRRNDYVVRYGNAIEFWWRSNNITVDNCWVYQIFDAAMTFQGHFNKEQARFTNVHFDNNLIEYCCMNIEFWLGSPQDEKTPHISDISYKGNIIRFGGYGWGGIQRADKSGQGMILGWEYSYDDMHNFVITENTLDCADSYMIHIRLPKEQEGLIVHNNIYYQKKNTGLHNCIQVVRGVNIIAENQQDLEKAISEFDSNPALVKWISD